MILLIREKEKNLSAQRDRKPLNITLMAATIRKRPLSLVSMACIQFATSVAKYESDSAFKDQYLDKQLDVIDGLLTDNL